MDVEPCAATSAKRILSPWAAAGDPHTLRRANPASTAAVTRRADGGWRMAASSLFCFAPGPELGTNTAAAGAVSEIARPLVHEPSRPAQVVDGTVEQERFAA